MGVDQNWYETPPTATPLTSRFSVFSIVPRFDQFFRISMHGFDSAPVQGRSLTTAALQSFFEAESDLSRSESTFDRERAILLGRSPSPLLGAESVTRGWPCISRVSSGILFQLKFFDTLRHHCVRVALDSSE